MMTGRERGASPLAPANGYPRSDQEAAMDEEELRRQKRKKLITYIVAFVIFQTIVIAVMSVTVMKIRTPKYRLRSVDFSTPNIAANKESFNMNMTAQLRVKNMNFGTYKYDASDITFYYNEVPVGSSTVSKSKVGWLSSKKFDVVVPLSSASLQGNTTELTKDLSSEVLPLTIRSTLNGNMRLTFMFKKKKSTKMDCAFDLNLSTKEITNMKC